MQSTRRKSANKKMEHLNQSQINSEFKELVTDCRSDRASVLVIHLLCEQILVSWLARSGKASKIKATTFANKLQQARTQKFPEQAANAFEEINNLRNEFAHQITRKEIPCGFCNALIEKIHPFTGGIESLDPRNICIDGNTPAMLSHHTTPERLKLCILLLYLRLQVSATLLAPGDAANPDESIGTATIKITL